MKKTSRAILVGNKSGRDERITSGDGMARREIPSGNVTPMSDRASDAIEVVEEDDPKAVPR